MLRFAAAAFVGFNLGKHGIARPFMWPGVDYEKHWHAAEALVQGLSVFRGERLFLYFNYPQWTAFFTWWLSLFTYEAGEKAWKFLGLLCIFGCWRIAWLHFRPSDWPRDARLDQARPLAARLCAGISQHWMLGSAFLVTMYAPAGASSLFIGNVDFLVAFLAMAAFGALLAGRERLGGAYLAMLCLVKMMPVVLIVPAIFWGRWKLLQGWFGFMLGYFFVLLLLGRVGDEWFFVHEAGPLIPHRWRGISMSPMKFIIKQAYPLGWEDPALFNRAVTISTAFWFSFVLATCALLRSKRWSFERGFEAVGIIVPLMSPLLEDHHMAVLLPIFVLHAVRLIRGQMEIRWAILYFAGWTILCLEAFITDMLQNVPHSYYSGALGLMILLTGVWGEAILGKHEMDRPRIPEKSAA